MTSAIRTLEHHEHAEHISHGEHGSGGHGEHGHGDGAGAAQPHAAPAANSAQWTALLVAFLAAGLALSEQGAKHGEIKVQQLAINATDAWGQYQAKSTRGTIAKDLADVVAALDNAGDPAAVARREKVIGMLKADQDKYEHDPKDGKDAIAERAHAFEHQRDHAMEETHAYHNGSAAMELGIVLATASAITRSRMLIYLAIGMGIAGGILAVLGYVAPQYGAF